MRYLDQKICAWSGLIGTALLGIGLLVAGFIPPPSPGLNAEQVAQLYQQNATLIRSGMIIALFAVCGLTALVAVISVQLRTIAGASLLPPYLQLAAGSLGLLTLLFPFMLFLIAAYRPDRDPELVLLLNDIGWLVTIPAFPTFIVQWAAITGAVLQDKSTKPVYPRWLAFFTIWVAVLTLTAPVSYFFHEGPFTWNGLFPFWLAGGVFFAWVTTMSWLTLKAICARELRERVS